jgi:hypothetical protein
MFLLTPVPWRFRQLIVMALWMAFVGGAMWQHTQQSTQPPIHDASTYYLKAHNFWDMLRQGKIFSALKVEPSFRPPGTVLMSYPLGFHSDYRNFYFRSIFLPIVLLGIAIIIAGYRRDLDSKSKWHLVLLTAFLSSLPAFYYFEVSLGFPAPSHWGLVDNFFGGVAALASAALVRSIWLRSATWLMLAALLASFCLFIKPTGALVMALIGMIWLGMAALRVRLVWQLPEERRSAITSLVQGAIIFGLTYLVVLVAAFSSNYLSRQNLAFGNAAIVIMQTELLVSWHAIRSMIHGALGYPFVAWALLAALLIGRYLRRKAADSLAWPKPMLVGLIIASCLVFIFGVWFWIFGLGGISQIRYFVPFLLMAAILAVPAIVQALQGMHRWEMLVLSLLMAVPVVNMDMLLVQSHPSTAWQKWSGVNMTSNARDPVVTQAHEFVAGIKREGRNVDLYSFPLNVTDANFQSVIDYSKIAAPPVPAVLIGRPVDWQRPSTYRLAEMLSADYWLFEPVHDQRVLKETLAKLSVEGLDQERELFQAWATKLTTSDGVELVSETSVARVLRITDPERLESALNALVAAHLWRNTFTTANPPTRFSEKDLDDVLALNPPAIENVIFSDRIELRALSTSRADNNTTVRIWWRPLRALQERDWALFVHSIDETGKIVLANHLPLSILAVRPDDKKFRFGMITFRNAPGSELHRLAIGFVRPNTPLLVADKGTRDWNNTRVIVHLP